MKQVNWSINWGKTILANVLYTKLPIYCRLSSLHFFKSGIERNNLLEIQTSISKIMRRNKPKTTVHILYTETWKVPPLIQNNTVIYEGVQIWYTVSINLWIFPCMKQVSSKNPLFQWKYCQELCLKTKLISEDMNFSFSNTMKKKIWGMLCIFITILDEFCFRGQNQKSSWNLIYTSEKFKANTRYVSPTTDVQITHSKHTMEKPSSLNTTHKIDGTIIRNAFFQYTATSIWIWNKLCKHLHSLLWYMHPV